MQVILVVAIYCTLDIGHCHEPPLRDESTQNEETLNSQSSHETTNKQTDAATKYLKQKLRKRRMAITAYNGPRVDDNESDNNDTTLQNEDTCREPDLSELQVSSRPPSKFPIVYIPIGIQCDFSRRYHSTTRTQWRK